MNLVDLYLREDVFPLHKILTWDIEQRTVRETEPIYTMGDVNPTSHSHSRGRRKESTLSITLIGLTSREQRYLQNMMGKTIKDLRLKGEREYSVLLKEGIIKSMVIESESNGPSHCIVMIDCQNALVEVNTPSFSGHFNSDVSLLDGRVIDL